MTDVLFTIGENPPPRLDKALARNVPERAISRSRLSRMIADGAVEVNGVVAIEQKARVVEGDKIIIHVPEAVESHMLPEDITLEILYEDDDLIVVNKPAGMVYILHRDHPRGHWLMLCWLIVGIGCRVLVA